MNPYHYGKEASLQGAQQATAAKRTVSPTGRLVRREAPETQLILPWSSGLLLEERVV
jgi:hypothetical protein